MIRNREPDFFLSISPHGSVWERLAGCGGLCQLEAGIARLLRCSMPYHWAVAGIKINHLNQADDLSSVPIDLLSRWRSAVLREKPTQRVRWLFVNIELSRTSARILSSAWRATASADKPLDRARAMRRASSCGCSGKVRGAVVNLKEGSQ